MNNYSMPKSIISFNSESISKENQIKLLQVAIELKSNERSRSPVQILHDLMQTFSIPKSKLLQLIALYSQIITLIGEVKESDFINRLNESGFSSDFIGRLQNYVKQGNVLDTLACGPFRSNLTKFHWRVDISFSDNILQTKVPKNVIICLELSDGQKFTIAMNVQTFHRLRYNTASVINEFKQLQLNNK